MRPDGIAEIRPVALPPFALLRLRCSINGTKGQEGMMLFSQFVLVARPGSGNGSRSNRYRVGVQDVEMRTAQSPTPLNISATFLRDSSVVNSSAAM